MKMLNLLVFLVFLLFFNSCDVSNSAPVDNQLSAKVQPTVRANDNTKLTVDVNSNKVADENEDVGNEITECSPQKIYRGETLKISFRENHGGHFAIYPENREKFYFIESENMDGENPQITETELKKLQQIELNTETTSKTDFNKTDSAENYVIAKVFDKTGWYRVIIGHQGLDVDFIDMPVTGSCRVYYVNKKRPRGK